MSSLFGGDIFLARYIQHLYTVPTSRFGRFSSNFNSFYRNFSNQKYLYELMLLNSKIFQDKKFIQGLLFSSLLHYYRKIWVFNDKRREDFWFEGKQTKIVMMTFAYYSTCYFFILLT
jgi:hypothetical protein